MSSIINYYRLSKHIKNWRTYFKRLHEKKQTTRYITKGKELKFDVPPIFFFVFKEIFMEDFYHIESLLKHIPNDAVILDIGCNAGLFSFIALSKKTNAKIYAYDPMEVNVNLFKNNVKLNDGLNEQVKIFKNAVTGKEQGPIKLFYDDVNNDSVIASVFENFSEHNNQSTMIDTISLTQIIKQNNLAKVDLLKLDCEGSEYPILYDSPEEIWNCIKAMTIETHELDNEKKNTKALVKFLIAKDYEIEMHQAENQCYSIRAYKRN